MEKDYFYLKGTEELGDIIDLIRNVKAKELILVVPAKTKALSHPVNLELFKREVERHKKKIYFSSEDEELIRLAKAAGFELFLEEYEALVKGAQLVTDIRPPVRTQTKTKVEEPLPSVAPSVSSGVSSRAMLTTSPSVAAKRRPSALVDTSRLPSRRFNFKKLIIIAVSVFVVFWVIAFVVGSVGGNAKVQLTVKKQTQTFDEIVIVDKNALADNVETQTVPGTFIDINKTHTVFQETTGSAVGSERPKGTLILENSSDQGLSLVVGTRFKSPSGKIYRSLSRNYVPPKSEGGEVRIQVVADGFGDDYAVEAQAPFTIPGLAGTKWENIITAKTEAAISGSGAAGVKTVTVDDINNGKVKLETELRNLLLKELAFQYPDFLFPEEPGSIDIEVVDISHKVGQEADKILISGRGELKAIGVKREILISMLKNIFAKKNLTGDKNIEITKLELESLKMKQLDPKFNTMGLQVIGKVTARPLVNQQQLASTFVGKSLVDIREQLKTMNNIEKAEIEVWPFWKKSFPQNVERIKITLD